MCPSCLVMLPGDSTSIRIAPSMAATDETMIIRSEPMETIVALQQQDTIFGDGDADQSISVLVAPW